LTKLVQFDQGDWILTKFFVCVDRDGVKVHKQAKKRDPGHYPAILTESLVNKGFIIWLSGKIFLQDTTGSPEWAK